MTKQPSFSGLSRVDFMNKLRITEKKYYIWSFIVILLLSIYPLIMGVQVIAAYFSNGYVSDIDYPKYVIPYTPIAIALIITVAVHPLVNGFCKRFALLIISILGVVLFLLSEILFEQVTVFSIVEGTSTVGSWQAALCIVTPEVMQTIEYKETIGEALAARYSPVFKVHFYLIAILIVIAVLGVVHGFGRMVSDSSSEKKKPLIMQTISVAVFICLCIFACFTAFYRTGDLNVSALSSWLMSGFFVVFGLTAGMYAGGLLYFKRAVISRFIPALIAAATTFIMYIGELVLMGGVLFKFGQGFMFDPIGICPFAPVDFIVIIASGLITYGILHAIRKQDRKE